MNFFARTILSRMNRNTVISVTMDSGSFFGPATLVDYNLLTGLVTLEEQGAVSPPSSTIVQISADKIESISYDRP